MSEKFDVNAYMTEGVERIVKDSLRMTFKNPRETAFLVKFAAASAKASKIREEAERKGEHVPTFLICSITSNCNLHCAGCYSRANHATKDCLPVNQLSDEDWLSIFDQAEEMGISFILLAGGEPMIRRDIIEAAGKKQNIIFPVFTNGTMMDERYMKLFDKCRNLIPIVSIEGRREATDARRGEGIHQIQMKNMDFFQKKNLLFGASITVTTDNLKEVSNREFLDSLVERGCKVMIYVEFVPVTEESRHLAPGDEEREYLRDQLMQLREAYPEVIFYAFPGDEKDSGGCIAAGRGFFHINSQGGAEPCPFSPYSDINVKETSLRQAMQSKLFRQLQEGGTLKEDHPGGCVLFERRDVVESILRQE